MYLQRFYGDRVTVEYYDMADQEQLEQHKALLDKVPPDRFFYPFTFINGELRLVGSCDYYQVLYALRDVVEPVQK